MKRYSLIESRLLKLEKSMLGESISVSRFECQMVADTIEQNLSSVNASVSVNDDHSSVGYFDVSVQTNDLLIVYSIEIINDNKMSVTYNVNDSNKLLGEYKTLMECAKSISQHFKQYVD